MGKLGEMVVDHPVLDLVLVFVLAPENGQPGRTTITGVIPFLQGSIPSRPRQFCSLQPLASHAREATQTTPRGEEV